MANARTNVFDYNHKDDGKVQKACECCCTGKAYIKTVGKVDWYHNGMKIEIKAGAGYLSMHGKSILKGNRVLFIPVPIVEEDGTINFYKQEGFLFTKADFMTMLENAGALRWKKSRSEIYPERDLTIQTYWNRKQDKPHGTLYFRILDESYSLCLETLEDALANGTLKPKYVNGR